MIIMMSSIISSSMFLVMKHPLSMGFMLFLQTILTCLVNGMIINSYWFSYILFITFIGGMLVLFTYIATIASNEKFKFSIKLMLMIIIMVMIMIIMMMLIDPQTFYDLTLTEMINYNTNIMMMKNKNILSITKMFNYPYMYMSILMIIYLLITMISVVKITNIKEGPLRMKN
uniref:NADH-ubiquinone oxidoreductase chain 6 n=1 Tax=Aphrophora sp. EMHAU-2015-Zz062722 TaxID=2038649 RepID=A0A343K648_9HEMI|nr:NADH dehydrogenase subunit 6 [Aphrophora sp. EMHAU-2015-Zz062722]ATV98840.1 NADH dehydrogenase subunit 6 [Aphrophora sp. EMHAU-15062702]